MNIDHTLWANKYLPSMACKWGYKYDLDVEDALEELYEQYVNALNHFDESKGVSFNNFFFFYRQKALEKLLNDRKHWKDLCVIDSDLLNEFEVTTDAITKIIDEVDKIKLDEDSLTMLQFIFDHDFSSNKKRARIGKETVCREIAETLNWTWKRAYNALDSIHAFYAERCYA